MSIGGVAWPQKKKSPDFRSPGFSIFAISFGRLVGIHSNNTKNRRDTYNSFEAAACAPKMASSDTVLKSKPAN